MAGILEDLGYAKLPRGNISTTLFAAVIGSGEPFKPNLKSGVTSRPKWAAVLSGRHIYLLPGGVVEVEVDVNSGLQKRNSWLLSRGFGAKGGRVASSITPRNH